MRSRELSGEVESSLLLHLLLRAPDPVHPSNNSKHHLSIKEKGSYLYQTSCPDKTFMVVNISKHHLSIENQENRKRLNIRQHFEGESKSVREPHPLRGVVQHPEWRDNIKAVTIKGEGEGEDKGKDNRHPRSRPRSFWAS